MANDKVAIWNQTIKLGRSPANGELLIGNGADFNLAALTAGSNVTITNSAGGITIASTNPGGTVTGVTASSPLASSGGTTPDISLSGTVAVGNGGTGATALTADNVILGNGNSAVQFVAPGTSGNILTSNGTTWISSAAPTTWTLVKKTSDQSITNNSTLADDTALFFAMAANKTYAIRAYYSIQVGAGGVKISYNGPASPTRLRFGSISAAGTTTGHFQNGVVGTSAYDTAIFDATSLAPFFGFHFQGTVTNGANAGNFVMRIAQSSSNAAATVYEKGSFLEYVEIV